MKRFVLIALALFSSLAFASVPVSVNMQTATGSTIGSNSYMRMALQNCGSNIPRVIGSGIVVKSTINFYPTSGIVSGTIYGNDEIDCGGSSNTVWQVQYVVNNVPISPARNYRVCLNIGDGCGSVATFDPSSAVPITSIATVPPPTGDTTYARLDGGNAGAGQVAYKNVANAYSQAQTFNAGTTFNAGATFNAGISGTGTIVGLTLGSAAVAAPYTWSATQTYALVNGKNINAVRYADQFAGADCGARIVAAFTDLASQPGTVVASKPCLDLGISTGVTIPVRSVLELRASGVVNQSAIITLLDSSVLYGPHSAQAVNTTPILQLKQVNSSNLASMVHVTGNFASLRDLGIDGNYATNSSAGPNILAEAAQRLNIENVTTGHSASHGLSLLTGSSSAKIFGLMSYENRLAGLNCLTNSGDGFISNSEMESNQRDGMVLGAGCAGWRVSQNDFGTNGAGGSFGDGLVINCTGAQPTNATIIQANQFGNNFRNDIVINGYNTGLCSYGNNITNNDFIGSGVRSSANTFSELRIIDGGYNVVSGNYFSASTPNAEAYGILFSKTVGFSGINYVANNAVNPTNPWGTGFLSDTSGNAAVASASASPIDLFDSTTGAANPHKALRVSAGNFQLLNNAGSSVILQVADNGTVLVPKLTVTDTAVVTNLNADMVDGVHVGNVSAGQAMCWKDATHLGYCSTAVSAGGACTCN